MESSSKRRLVEESTSTMSMTVSEIECDWLTKIASENLLKKWDLVKEIYRVELRVRATAAGKEEGRKTVPLQRVMILEVSGYLENYLWPNFETETASFEHVMYIILMVNEKFRENLPAWSCFNDRKDVFKGFLRRALLLNEGQGEGRELTIPEKTNYLVFLINAFQSLADEIVSRTELSLSGLQSWHCLSDGCFKMEICLYHELGLIERWRRLVKRGSKQALKRGVPFEPSALPKAKFLRNLVEEFLEVLDQTVFLHNPCIDGDGDDNDNDSLVIHASGS